MPLQMINLEEVQMMEFSDDVLELSSQALAAGTSLPPPTTPVFGSLC